MTEESKTCPMCAEQVKAAAKICRFDDPFHTAELDAVSAEDLTRCSG